VTDNTPGVLAPEPSRAKLRHRTHRSCEERHMADATQLTAVNRAIDELKATVADARGAYGEAPAFRRLMNDVERLSIDASELDTVAPAAAPPPPVRIPIDDSPPDPAMWTDADDEGVGGFHGPHGGSASGSHR
jgi:hypothetical protein